MKFAIAVATAALALAGLTACGEDRPCLRSHQEYQPPIYVKVGSVMVPTGGGMHAVCDKHGEAK